MKLCLVILVLLHHHYITGWPLSLPNMNHVMNVALKASVDEVNKQSFTFNLYKATTMPLHQIRPVDIHTLDLVLDFDMKETMCLKSHTGSLDICPYTWGFSSVRHPETRCGSSVRVSGHSVSVQWVTCEANTVSSSSEELFLW